jgi:hypothetical protein
MSTFTPEQQKEIDDAIASAVSKYVKVDSWWQTLRREHPLAVQNILLFGGMLVWGSLGFLIGRISA